MKRWCGAGAAFPAFLAVLLVSASPALAGEGSRVEAFAGYYVAEEAEEDLSYGARFGWDSGNGWGLMGSYEGFETEGKGYGEPGGIDAEIQHVDFSYVAYPGGGDFELFSGLGAAMVDVDHGIAGPVVDLEKTSLSIHAGIGYRIELGDVLYLRPELRARGYKVGDETIDVTASLAIGFDFGSD